MEFLAVIVEAVELRCVAMCAGLEVACHREKVESLYGRVSSGPVRSAIAQAVLRLLIGSARGNLWILSCFRKMHLYRDSGAAAGYCASVVIVVMVPRQIVTTCR